MSTELIEKSKMVGLTQNERKTVSMSRASEEKEMGERKTRIEEVEGCK